MHFTQENDRLYASAKSSSSVSCRKSVRRFGLRKIFLLVVLLASLFAWVKMIWERNASLERFANEVTAQSGIIQFDDNSSWPESRNLKRSLFRTLSDYCFGRFSFKKIEGIILHGDKASNQFIVKHREHLCFLRGVVLNSTKLDHDGIGYLFALSKIETLSVENQSFDCAILSRIVNARALRFLSFAGAGLEWDNCTALSRLPALEGLVIRGEAGFSDEEIKRIAECKSIRSLYIDQSNVKDYQLIEFSKMTQLRRLVIYGVSGYSSQSEKALLSMPELETLEINSLKIK